jgi:hypothetical protein
MGQPRDFLYFLTDSNGKSYRINNGLVEAVSTPTPLSITPDGWQDKSIKYQRLGRYFSMFRSFTTPLKYVRDGSFIVRDRLYRLGTENKIYQVIHWLDKSFGGGWVHKFFYRGELDLSQFEDDDTHVTVNIMEGDLSKLFKANENQTYEIDINVPEAVTIKHDGLYLHEKHNFIVQGAPVLGDHLLGTLFLNSEGKAAGVATFTVFSQPVPGSLATSTQYFLVTTQAITGIRIKGSIRFTPNTIIPGYGLRLKSNLGRNDLIASTVVIGNFTLDFDFTFDAQAGEQFFLVGDLNSEIIGGIYGETSFSLEFRSRYKTTYIKALRASYVAQKLLDKITGGGYAFTSDYLSTEWDNLLITSGDAIRGFENAKLKLSWTDFYDSYNVPCNICCGIRNQVLYIEEKADAFQPTILLNLGEVNKMKVRTAKEYQYNRLKIGYPNIDTEDVNGRDEFNVTSEYTSPVTRVNKALELVSKAYASMYEIEQARIDFIDKTTTDGDSDNRLFLIHVEKEATAGVGDEPASYHRLLRNTYDNFTGVLDPESAFNVELHPELCLRRHGNFLRSIFYWQESGELVYQTNTRNGNVKVVKDGDTYIGNKNINIGTLDAPLFIPLEFLAESPISKTIINTMEAGPSGTFQLSYGSDIYGFPVEIGIQPADNAAQETIMLCSPQTDLTKLIVYGR